MDQKSQIITMPRDEFSITYLWKLVGDDLMETHELCNALDYQLSSNQVRDVIENHRITDVDIKVLPKAEVKKFKYVIKMGTFQNNTICWEIYKPNVYKIVQALTKEIERLKFIPHFGELSILTNTQYTRYTYLSLAVKTFIEIDISNYVEPLKFSYDFSVKDLMILWFILLQVSHCRDGYQANRWFVHQLCDNQSNMRAQFLKSLPEKYINIAKDLITEEKGSYNMIILLWLLNRWEKIFEPGILEMIQYVIDIFLKEKGLLPVMITSINNWIFYLQK